MYKNGKHAIETKREREEALSRPNGVKGRVSYGHETLRNVLTTQDDENGCCKI